MNSTYINNLKNQQLAPALDVQFLREEARRQVEKLANTYWTDYNTHDPGITMLEILAYAITDLGLRTQLEIQDLLSSGYPDLDLFNASQILPNAALTQSDYQRLLTDYPNIRKAWVETLPGALQGLYTLLVELEPTPLNLSIVWLPKQTISIAPDRNFAFDIVLPYWANLNEEQRQSWEGENDLTNVEITKILPLNDPEKTHFDEYALEGNFTFESVISMAFRVHLPIGVPKKASDGSDNTAQEIAFRQALFDSLNGNSELFSLHQERSRIRRTQLNAIEKNILGNRNLCEDWSDIQTARVQQIAVQIAELELQQEANPEEVIAQIFFAIDQFIDPIPRTYTYNDLLNIGKSPAEIFDGPLLRNGFIQEEELVSNQNKLYTSDLVRIIMQNTSVIGLSNLNLDLYLDRARLTTGVVQCLSLFRPELYKPKFSLSDSTIRVFKRRIPVDVDMEKVSSRFRELKEAYIASFPTQSLVNPIVPTGDEQLDIATFYSIQNDFPQTYGLKEGEIVQSAPPLRKAQAKQLKAYLLFFEQLLNNYCEQLANVQALFSIQKNVDRTYFYQPLYEVPAVKDLYLSFMAEQQGTAPLSWKEFKQNSNQYLKDLDFATEDRQIFLQRRNQFVNHLLARFAEDFTDYAAWTFVHHNGAISPDLIFDKLDFLKSFPSLSSERATGFDYTAVRFDEDQNELPDVWDTTNVSGLEKRVAALLGIPNISRRSLGTHFDINNFIEDKGDHFDYWNAPLNQVNANPDQFKVLLSSRNAFSEEEAKRVTALAQKAKNYKVFQVSDNSLPEISYYFNLLDGDIPVAELPAFPSNRAEPEAAIQEIIHLVQGRSAEGMHLIEHILLRPKEGSTVALEPVAFPVDAHDQTGDAISIPLIEEDLYSFQISIFLPGWAPRMRDPEFRVVVEQKIRAEVPAHIFAWIYWVELDQSEEIPSVFSDFEIAYKNWLENRYPYNPANTLDALITAINALASSEFVTLTNTYEPFEL